MNLIDHLELTIRATELAEDLSHGHYSIGDAIGMLNELAAAHRSITINLLELQNSAVAFHNGIIKDPLPKVGQAVAHSFTSDIVEEWQEKLQDPFIQDAGKRAAKAIEVSLQLTLRNIEQEADIEPASPRF